MNKSKSVFVTLVIAAMLAVILAGAYKIENKAFYTLLAALAGYGFLRGASDLCRWLQAKDDNKDAVPTEEADQVDLFAHDDEFAQEGKARFSFGTIRFRDAEYEEAAK